MSTHRSDLQRQSDEEVRQNHRRGPWQLFEKKAREAAAEAERKAEWARRTAPGREQMMAPFAKPAELSREEREERLRQSAQTAAELQQSYQRARQEAVEFTRGAENDRENAYSARDLKAYADADARYASGRRYLDRLDEAEQSRRQRAAAPFFAPTDVGRVQ